MTGRSNRVSLLTGAHAYSQACSHRLCLKYQRVMQCCEDCEAIFLLFLEMKNLIGGDALSVSTTCRYKGRDSRLTLLTNKRRRVMDKAWNKSLKRIASQGKQGIVERGRSWDRKLKKLARQWNGSVSGPSMGVAGAGRARRSL